MQATKHPPHAAQRTHAAIDPAAVQTPLAGVMKLPVKTKALDPFQPPLSADI